MGIRRDCPEFRQLATHEPASSFTSWPHVMLTANAFVPTYLVIMVSTNTPGDSGYDIGASTPRTNYALGMVRDRTNFDISVPLTANDWKKYSAAVSDVMRLEPPFQYQLVERNFRQLLDMHQFVAITLSLGRKFADPTDRRTLVQSVMGAAVNWLTSMRMFLDHEETQLKRTFGAKSNELDSFQASTHKAYDTEVGYRFAYQFRNYVLHCGLPVSKLQFRAPSAPEGIAVQKILLLLERDRLLADFDGWKGVASDIRKFPPEFELLPLAEGAMRGLRAVHGTCVDLDLDVALSSGLVIREALDLLKGEGEPTLFRYVRRDDGGFDITPTQLQAATVRTLITVAEGKVPRDSLFADANAHAENVSPMLEPATIRRRFHKDTRGAQLITAFLNEGGGTPAFVDLVNQYLHEDQSIEPMLTGVLDAAMVFVHMTAGALGTTAAAIVPGVLEFYSRADLASEEIDE